jgi:hypothetical protein
MIAVAVLALGLYAYPFIDELLSEDGPFHAIRLEAKSWDCGPAPTVSINLFEGSIRVFPAADGNVSADIMALSLTSRSQWAADGALETIEVTASQKGDLIEILASGASVDGPLWRGYITNTVDVNVFIPDGVSLKLIVAQGSIDVGTGWSGTKRVRRPVAAESIIARNESRHGIGGPFGWGNVIIDTVVPRGPSDGGPGITHIDVQATGKIEINAENALIESATSGP